MEKHLINNMPELLIAHDQSTERCKRDQLKDFFINRCEVIPEFIGQISDVMKKLTDIAYIDYRLIVFISRDNNDLGTMVLERVKKISRNVPAIVINCCPGVGFVHQLAYSYDFVRFVIDVSNLFHSQRLIKNFIADQYYCYREEKTMSKIFIVHGHAHDQVKRIKDLLYQLNVKPIVLAETRISGLTIIESLERHRDVDYVIVLLTADDYSSESASSAPQKKRARQNVILEAGLFMGMIGRNRVMFLCDDNIEWPSDYNGLLHVKLSASDDVIRMRLIQQFMELQIKFDLVVPLSTS